MNPRQPAFNAVLTVPGIPRDLWSDPGNILAFDNILDAWGAHREQATVSDLTERIVLEILEHEALVLEAYRDSAKVWTWSAGLTNASGHTVFPRYKDNPQPIKRCIEVYLWALRERYLPTVLRAFDRPLSEHELGAALSFHWNTGAIGTADWVELVNEGRMDEARRSIMNWSKPKEIIPRRKLERDLFFDGRWTSDGLVTVYEVSKPSYTPKWSSARQIDVRGVLRELLG